jgi:hypothetical protein
MNVWIVNEMIEKDQFEQVIKPAFLLKSICMIIVDLTRVKHINNSHGRLLKVLKNGLISYMTVLVLYS